MLMKMSERQGAREELKEDGETDEQIDRLGVPTGDRTKNGRVGNNVTVNCKLCPGQKLLSTAVIKSLQAPAKPTCWHKASSWHKATLKLSGSGLRGAVSQYMCTLCVSEEQDPVPCARPLGPDDGRENRQDVGVGWGVICAMHPSPPTPAPLKATHFQPLLRSTRSRESVNMQLEPELLTQVPVSGVY
ncbi:hypothetical protein SRHO_G00128870 [Serrasalmus rhombeus]